MPYVVNGCGTWYYGKRKIHRIKGTCGFCNRIAELESYDTTLYFVFVMIPLLPLANKRILQQCPACSKHQALPLKKWEQLKAKDKADVLDRLLQNSSDRDLILKGLGMAIAYQDEVFFDKLVAILTDKDKHDAAIQELLGAGYGYFSRWAEAASSYRAALSVQDNADNRQQLALALLKLRRPADAAPLLEPILEEKDKEQAGMIYVLIEAYQAEGMHQEALDLLQRRDAAFPELTSLKEYQQQRKLSEKHLQTGKKIKSAFLNESKKVGYREGSWTASIPKVIGPLVFLGLLLWYLGAAYSIGRSRKVYLVNGATKPYTVAYNGHEQLLHPGVATPVHIPEGEITLTVRDADLGPTPLTCTIETSFFARPFQRRTFAINPDRLAVFIKDQAQYAEIPGALNGQPEIHLNELLYAFQGIDYEFAPFPATIKLKKGQTIVKTQVDLAAPFTSEARIRYILSLDPAQQRAYAERLLQIDPADSFMLHWQLSRLEKTETLAFLEPRLAVRPVLVDWHRSYQDHMERHQPDRDLRPQYRQLIAETNAAPDAEYLLARLVDQDEEVRLLERAAAAPTPSPYAQASLGQLALAQGKFPEAVRWLERAVQSSPANPFFREYYRLALSASDAGDRLFTNLQTGQPPSPWDPKIALEKVRYYGRKGDKAAARAAIETVLRSLPKGVPAEIQEMLRPGFEMAYCCSTNDVAGYLKLDDKLPDQPKFAAFLLRGKLDDAAAEVDPAKQEEAVVRYALIHLAALKANDRPRADKARRQLLETLAKGRRLDRQLGDALSGKKPLPADRLQSLRIDPSQKRVLLVVAARQDPNHAKQLVDLARRLDFFGDATSLCLRKVMD